MPSALAIDLTVLSCNNRFTPPGNCPFFYIHTSISRLEGIITGIVLMMVFTAVLATAQTPVSPPPVVISPRELDLAKKGVTTFCAYWKTLKLDSLYTMMSETAKAAMPKEKFLSLYGKQQDISGIPGSFTLKDAVQGDDGIIVSVKLVFAKEHPPAAVNGIHGFHMIKEKGKWKVKAVVPPIAPPEEIGGSGGHPGE